MPASAISNPGTTDLTIREPLPAEMMYQSFMLHQDAQGIAGDSPIRWLWFRSGEIEHRQTANLAFRMGGRELLPRRVMSKLL